MALWGTLRYCAVEFLGLLRATGGPSCQDLPPVAIQVSATEQHFSVVSGILVAAIRAGFSALFLQNFCHGLESGWKASMLSVASRVSIPDRVTVLDMDLQTGAHSQVDQPSGRRDVAHCWLV